MISFRETRFGAGSGVCLAKGGDNVERRGKKKGSKLRRNLDPKKHTTCVYSKDFLSFPNAVLKQKDCFQKYKKAPKSKQT